MGSLYNLRMKHERAGKVDVEELREDTDKYINENIEARERVHIDEKVPYGENVELDIAAGIWAFVAENIEREEWKSYTREDWAQLENEYVRYADYTEPDLFDDILTEYEAGKITADEAQAKAKQYRRCNHRFCLNVFKPVRKAQKYCSGKDCRQLEFQAIKNYEMTGTYLPASVYKEIRGEEVENKYKEKELLFNLAEAGNEDGEEDATHTAARIQANRDHMVYGGKRNRQQEDINDSIAYKYKDDLKENKKDLQEPPIKRYFIPVKDRRKKSGLVFS